MSFGIGVLIRVDETVVFGTVCRPVFLTQLEPPVLQVKKPRLGIAVRALI
jgi:hypothetical protein